MQLAGGTAGTQTQACVPEVCDLSETLVVLGGNATFMGLQTGAEHTPVTNHLHFSTPPFAGTSSAFPLGSSG